VKGNQNSCPRCSTHLSVSVMLKKKRTHLCPLDGGFQLKSCNVLHCLGAGMPRQLPMDASSVDTQLPVSKLPLPSRSIGKLFCSIGKLRSNALMCKHLSRATFGPIRRCPRLTSVNVKVSPLVWRLESSDTFQEISFFIWSQSQLQSQG
jgi:hypothetical protein